MYEIPDTLLANLKSHLERNDTDDSYCQWIYAVTLPRNNLIRVAVKSSGTTLLDATELEVDSKLLTINPDDLDKGPISAGASPEYTLCWLIEHNPIGYYQPHNPFQKALPADNGPLPF